MSNGPATVPVIVAFASVMASCSLESNQTASECERAIIGSTNAALTRLASREVPLRDARRAAPEEKGIISHELWGDKAKFPALARVLEARGFRTSVEPEEYGFHLRIDEPVGSFRQHAAERVSQLCKLGDRMNLRYKGWSLRAGRHSDYVMQ